MSWKPSFGLENHRHIANGLELFLVRLLGKKFTGTDQNMLVEGYKWNGKFYLTKVEDLKYNACREPCDNTNGPCVCGAWHEEKRND